MTYIETVNSLAQAVRSTLRRQQEIDVNFDAPHTRGRAPTDARSEFLSNRGMGDWAETTLRAALTETLPGYVALKYGNDDAISAGDPAFAEFYKIYQDELSTTGKRPDLLLFRSDGALPNNHDISQLPLLELNNLTREAAFAIEVRSSKYLADVYAEARIAEGKKGRRAVQSFTVKVEDLRLVVRWIRAFGVRHFYAQVFLDSAYLISFADLLGYISEFADGVSVEQNPRNQDKPTIHVPVTYGARVADFLEQPEFKAAVKTTRVGRVDAFVKPMGGKLLLRVDMVQKVLSGN